MGVQFKDLPNHPDPLLREFLQERLPFPELHPVQHGWANPDKAWSLDPESLGWVPLWFPNLDSQGNSLLSSLRAQAFHDQLLRHLGSSRDSLPSESDSDKKQSVALALLHMLYEQETGGIPIHAKS